MQKPVSLFATPLLILLTLVLVHFLAISLQAAEESPAPSSTPMTENPLLTESSLPFQYPPFDRIKDEHFTPAYEKGMADELKEVEAIAANPEKPTFENTLVAMERSGQLLARVDRIFSNLVGANTNPTLQKIEKEMAPKLAAHKDAISLNGPLFARVQTLYNNREKAGLDPEAKWLVERYYKDFVRAGAKLSDADKTKLKAINSELAELQTTFEQNVLKEKNSSSVVFDKREDLDGLSDNEIAAAAAAAKADKKEGKFVITIQNTSGQPALASLKNRALRERI
jgi:peptidyl-dipeptidase Dcp